METKTKPSQIFLQPQEVHEQRLDLTREKDARSESFRFSTWFQACLTHPVKAEGKLTSWMDIRPSHRGELVTDIGVSKEIHKVGLSHAHTVIQKGESVLVCGIRNDTDQEIAIDSFEFGGGAEKWPYGLEEQEDTQVEKVHLMDSFQGASYGSHTLVSGVSSPTSSN